MLTIMESLTNRVTITKQKIRVFPPLVILLIYLLEVIIIHILSILGEGFLISLKAFTVYIFTFYILLHLIFCFTVSFE